MPRPKYRIEINTDSYSQVEEYSWSGEEFYWWRVVSSNGQTILTSETYPRKAAALRTARVFANWVHYSFRIPIVDLTKEKH